ncbi:MAG: phosphatidate cytidylyltransferase [Phycisphaerae bacterium]
MVRQRVLYGSILMAGLVALVVTDAALSRPDAVAWRGGLGLLGYGGLTTLAFALLVLVGAAELCRLCRQAGHRPAVAWSLIMSVLMMIGPWLASPGPRAIFSESGLGFAEWTLLERLLPWLAVLGTASILVWRQRTDGAVADFATTLLVIFYVGYLGSFCVRARCWWPGPAGAWLILSMLVVIKVTDIGAYFTGIVAGRRLLIPKVSPKKTWEGLIGGIAAAAVVSGLLLGWAVPRFGGATALCDLSMLQAVVFGIVMAIVGQLGDLAESLFKRDSGAKDSARLVPTFGGVLDIIDSPLMAVPVAYWLLRWWLLG